MYVNAYNTTMLNMTVTEARSNLRQALEHIKNGEEVELSQNGTVIAVMIHPDKLRTRIRTVNTMAADALLANLRRGRSASAAPRKLTPSLSLERAMELERDVRAGRDGIPE
jgi:antitoxin (DNA-binding transcriptional repressor) of toxin-antitoxin stability system